MAKSKSSKSAASAAVPKKPMSDGAREMQQDRFDGRSSREEAMVAALRKAFLATVNAAIERSGDTLLANRAAQFADQGLGKSWETLAPEQQKLWNDSLPALIHELRGGLTAGDGVDGWVYPPFNMALYGEDDDMRARVALGGLAALPRIEAIYVSATKDGEGRPLSNGGKRGETLAMDRAGLIQP